MSERRLRLDRLGRRLQGMELDGLLVSHPANLYYLFGFSGSYGAALWLEGESAILVDSRYLEQARDETTGCRVLLSSDPFGPDLRSLVSRPRRIGFEADRLSHSTVLDLSEWSDCWKLVATRGLVETLRAVKSAEEIGKIESACRLANRAFGEFVDRLDWSETENAAAGNLEQLCRSLGSAGTPFETIVAAGPRSALPHGVASGRQISREEVLLVDFGTRLEGYCSDLTRVLVPDSGEVRRIRDTVQHAQDEAVAAVRPGASVTAVDGAARSVIRSAGYGDFFGHGTGHGLGIEVHELPRISPRGDGLLTPGMVFTVEPGIYLPGQFGIRLEEVVAVTENSCRVLSRE